MSGLFGFGAPGADHPASTLSDRDGLYVAESGYLDHMISLAAAHLERLRISGEAADAGTGHVDSLGEAQLTAAYQATRNILESLRNHPQRRERSLEDLLGDSLRDADRRLAAAGSVTRPGSGYGPEFWQIEQERNICATILRHWWHWLHGEPVGV